MDVIGRLHDAFADTGEGANMDKRNGLRPIDPKKIAGMVAGLAKRVPELDGTDLIILAIALADPDSACLLTRDHVLVRSEKIMACEEELRNADRRDVRLRITYTL